MSNILFICIWILTILLMSVIIAKVIVKKSVHKMGSICNIPLKGCISSPQDSVDIDFGDLKIERIAMVSSASLQRRGSWRLALNNVMSKSDFYTMCESEYKKSLK